MDDVTAWLLEGSPWVQYRTRIDLLDQQEDDPEVYAARLAMIAHPQIRDLLVDLADWPGEIMKNHKNSGHPLHKLTFIANLGFNLSDPGIEGIVERIMEHQAPEGPFQILVNIKPGYGGTGEDQWAWMLCDAPLVLYTLVKFGLKEDRRVDAATRYLVGLIRENGWPCSVSLDLGKFRGPGRKADPCPYANLAMLKLMTLLPDWRESEASRIGAETLLQLWEIRKESRPYMFAMGSGFTKLKAPVIWYDILHVLEVLSKFPWVYGDVRFQEMLTIVKTKADEAGRYTPESIWMPWKEWEFGQKKIPSRWLTLNIHHLMKRLDNVSIE